MKFKEYIILYIYLNIDRLIKIVGEFLETFGGFLGTFLVPFFGSIFPLFLVNSQSRICLFYGTFWISRVVLDPFWDPFWTVHFIMIFTFVGYMCLVALLKLSRVSRGRTSCVWWV